MNTPHLIEIALLMLAAFLIGCVIGFFLRKLVGGETSASTTSAQSSATPSPANGADKEAPAANEGAPKTETKAEAAKPAPAKSESATKAGIAKKTTAKKTSPAKTTAKTATTAKAKSTASKPKTAAAKPAAKKPAAKKTTAAKPAAATNGKPATLKAPRAGGKDDLKNIKGVGPKIEGILNDMGIFHYDQVASWGRKEVKWVDEELSFKGRIDREKWISQAKKLAKDGAK